MHALDLDERLQPKPAGTPHAPRAASPDRLSAKDSAPSGVCVTHPRSEPRTADMTVLLIFRDDFVILRRDTGLQIQD
jgi:hypothetical protein